MDFSYDNSYFYSSYIDEDAGYMYVKAFSKTRTDLNYSGNAISYSLNSQENNILYITCSPLNNIGIVTGSISDEGYLQVYKLNNRGSL
jgi:hypothetical protein